MFKEATLKDVNYIYSERMAEKGLEHGFLGKPFNFRGDALGASVEHFKKLFDVTALFLPQQVHGDKIIDCRRGVSEQQEGDAVFLDLEKSPRIAYGIRTADCLPLILYSGSAVVLVHAGWRGLANGIIKKAVNEISGPDERLDVLIGPAAGVDRYEVGREVIEAIGVHASFVENKGKKPLLSLQQTCLNQLVSLGVKRSSVELSDICTISSSDYHSWRRDREEMGSNLSFVIIRA